jgi:hypothetical protein
VRRTALDVSLLPDGYRYRFDATSENLSQLGRLVAWDQCCAFLTFRIVDGVGQYG